MRKKAMILTILFLSTQAWAYSLVSDNEAYLKNFLNTNGHRIESVELLENNNRNKISNLADKMGQKLFGGSTVPYKYKARIQTIDGAIIQCNRVIVFVDAENESIKHGSPEVSECTLL